MAGKLKRACMGLGSSGLGSLGACMSWEVQGLEAYYMIEGFAFFPTWCPKPNAAAYQLKFVTLMFHEMLRCQ